ncbi:spore coat protein CotD [Pseudalkalibacillus caeni]|uniref:Spore coat protein CotD n=2 Tax=Exobacillus caeni TaxID=2574798 RepID=A0A5R9EYT4_9BACL|nr:spore coat protein CotD [Pseudalkalibacillus caeni]
MGPGPGTIGPIMHPVKECVKHHFCKTNVQHVHPTHIKNVYHHLYEHYHNYPLTQSNVVESANVHHYPPPRPTGAMPMGPSAVSPASMGPGGMGPGGMGPGPGPMGPTGVSPYGNMGPMESPMGPVGGAMK